MKNLTATTPTSRRHRAPRIAERVRVPCKFAPDKVRMLDELCEKENRSRNNCLEQCVELRYRQVFRTENGK